MINFHPIHFDIRICPQIEKHFTEPTLIECGDTHGNVLKLIHFLTNSGAFSLSDAQYSELFHIYEEAFDQPLSLSNFQKFSTILKSIEITPGYEQHLFRLLGDFICDRGSNDALTFEALRIFREKGLNIQTFSGNHEKIFWLGLYQYIFETHSPSHLPSYQRVSNDLFTRHECFYRSAKYFFLFLESAPPDIQKQLLNECFHYLNTTQFITMQFTIEEVDELSIEIASHAPLNFDVFHALASDVFNLGHAPFLKQIPALNAALQTQLRHFSNILQKIGDNKADSLNEKAVSRLLKFLFKDKTLDAFLNERGFNFDQASKQIPLEKTDDLPSEIRFIHAHTGSKNAVLAETSFDIIRRLTMPNVLTAIYRDRMPIRLINYDSVIGQSYLELAESEKIIHHFFGPFICRTQELSAFFHTPICEASPPSSQGPSLDEGARRSDEDQENAPLTRSEAIHNFRLFLPEEPVNQTVEHAHDQAPS